MRPGLTGQWQASGRSAIKDFEETVNLDLYYQRQYSGNGRRCMTSIAADYNFKAVVTIVSKRSDAYQPVRSA